MKEAINYYKKHTKLDNVISILDAS